MVFGTDRPFDMDFDWPVFWGLGLESLTQEEKEAIFWKNLEGLLGISLRPLLPAPKGWGAGTFSNHWKALYPPR